MINGISGSTININEDYLKLIDFVSFEILKPLIIETSDKIKYLNPTQAQTGPAVRKDTATIAAHLQFIKNTDTKEIYKLLTKSIIDHVQKL